MGQKRSKKGPNDEPSIYKQSLRVELEDTADPIL